MSTHDHLDLDALADVLAGEREAADTVGCATCGAALAELEAASASVAAALGSLPAPEVPLDLASRLDAALASAAGATADPTTTAPVALGSASVTTLPARDASSDRADRAGGARRWLPAAAAAVVLVGGLGLGISTLDGGSDESTTASGAADSAGRALEGLVRNDSGTTYTTASLPGAVPSLLAGDAARLGAPAAALPAPASDAAAGGVGATTGGSTGGEVATPRGRAGSALSGAQVEAFAAGALDRLRTPEGLAGCLVALLPPDDDSVQPLALDYGAFVVDGTPQPALVVVLPVPQREDKLDVFVVGAGCAPADEQLLHFARVDRP